MDEKQFSKENIILKKKIHSVLMRLNMVFIHPSGQKGSHVYILKDASLIFRFI